MIVFLLRLYEKSPRRFRFPALGEEEEDEGGGEGTANSFCRFFFSGKQRFWFTSTGKRRNRRTSQKHDTLLSGLGVNIMCTKKLIQNFFSFRKAKKPGPPPPSPKV